MITRVTALVLVCLGSPLAVAQATSSRHSSGSAAAGPGTRIPAQNAPKPGAGGR